MLNPLEFRQALTEAPAGRGSALECARALVVLLFKELVDGKSPIGCELELLMNRLDRSEDPIWKMLPAMQRMMLNAALSSLTSLVEEHRAQRQEKA